MSNEEAKLTPPREVVYQVVTHKGDWYKTLFTCMDYKMAEDFANYYQGPEETIHIQKVFKLKPRPMKGNEL